ncbi:hypothetical protein WJX77_001548 [Trebouxia sp. C0004]
MNPSNEERAALRKLLQARLNGKVTGFQDAHLNAMLKQGLSTEGRLAIASRHTREANAWVQAQFMSVWVATTEASVVAGDFHGKGGGLGFIGWKRPFTLAILVRKRRQPRCMTEQLHVPVGLGLFYFARELYDHDQLSNGWVDSEAQLHFVLDKFKDNHRSSQRPKEDYVPLSSHVDAV